MSACTKRTRALLSCAFALGDAEDVLVEIDADDFVRAAAASWRRRRSRRCCSTGRARACRRRIRESSLRLSRWSAKKPVLCLVPGAARKRTPCSVIDGRLRRARDSRQSKLSCFCTCSSANQYRSAPGKCSSRQRLIRSRCLKKPAEKYRRVHSQKAVGQTGGDDRAGPRRHHGEPP